MTALRAPRLEGAIRLGNGRKLGYAEFGPADGRVILWFHGTPGARRQIPPIAREAAYEQDLRVIGVERPGIGASTPHVHDSVVGFARDIDQMTRALGIERFGVVGLSGGGPYALACAHEMPKRVVTAAVLGGLAPSVGDEAAHGGVSGLTPRFSPLLRLARRPMGSIMQGVTRALQPVTATAIDLFASLMPPGDQRVFADPLVREMFADDLTRGSRRGMEAMFIDAILFGRHWGFALRDIRVPVRFWHGDSDNITPLSHGEHMAGLVPDAELRVRAEEGHLGGFDATHEVFDAILGHWRRRT